MQKKLFKNLSILLIFGIFVKILGLYNKIILTRALGLKGLSMYTKMLPIASLFLTISSFSLAPVITELVSTNIAKRPYSNRDLIYRSLRISVISASLVSIIHLILNYFICHFLLKSDYLIKPFLGFIPFYYLASITGIFKGYFHGHNKMDVYALGQLIEQIVRIILCFVLIIPSIKKNVVNGVVMAILTLSISEIFQNIYLFVRVILFTKLKGKRIIKAEEKTIFYKGLSLTSSKLIGAITNFLEPIIYTMAFLKTGLMQDYADILYGIICGYSIPIILTTSFITQSIEAATLPPLINSVQNNDYNSFCKTINRALYLSYVPALAVTFLYFFFPYEIMRFFYHTENGAYYIKLMAIPAFLAYFEGVFVSSLLALKKEKQLLYNTLFNNFIYLFLLYSLVKIPAINALGLVISFSTLIVIQTITLFIILLKTKTYKPPYKKIIIAFLYFALMIFFGLLSTNYLYRIILFFCFPIGALIPLIRSIFDHQRIDNATSLN